MLRQCEIAVKVLNLTLQSLTTGGRGYETKAGLEEVSMLEILIRGIRWNTGVVWAKRYVGWSFTLQTHVERAISMVMSISSFKST